MALAILIGKRSSSMLELRSRILPVLLVAAMMFGNLDLVSLAAGPGENGPGSNSGPRALFNITQTAVPDWKAGSGTNVTILNESGGELRLSGIETIDPGAALVRVRDLEVDSRGNLYMATQSGGIFKIQNGTDILTDQGRALPDEDNILCIAMDRNDNLWGVGRSFSGTVPNRGGIVWRMNTTTMRFDAAGKAENANGAVWGICCDRNGTVWAGTTSGIVARFDQASGTVTRLNSGNPLIPGSGIFQMAAASNGIIYAGTSNSGGGGRIIRIDPTTNNFQTLNTGNPIVNNDGINAMHVANNGHVYGGTSGVGGNVFMINTANDQITLMGKPIAGCGAIGDLYPAPDGSLYGTAGAGTLPDFHIFRMDTATGKFTDIAIPVPGTNWPGPLAVAPDGTVWGAGVTQMLYRLAPEYPKQPSARLNRPTTGRIFTENFELSDINWDWTISGGTVNFNRVADPSRPAGDRTVYEETSDSPGAYAKIGSSGPIATNVDSFPGNPVSVLETSLKMNTAGSQTPCGVRLFMDWVDNTHQYELIFYEDTDTVMLWRDIITVATYNGMSIDPGFWYNIKWKVWHPGPGGSPNGAMSVWVNDTKIFDDVQLVPPTHTSGAVVLGTRFYDVSFDNIRLYKDTNITVDGLQAGQNVRLFALNGTQVASALAAGPAVVLNVNSTSFQFAGYFNITDKNGVTVIYTSPIFPDIFGGDSYHFDKNPIGSSWTYLPGGAYVSQPLDAGWSVHWKDINWTALIPAGTNITVRTRTAPTQGGLAAAQWSPGYNAAPCPISSPDGRWIQFKADFTTTSPVSSPELRDLTVEYEAFPNFTIEVAQSSSLLYPDDIVVYTIFYNQTGNSLARDVSIFDFLSPGLVFINSSDEGARTGSFWKKSGIAPLLNGTLSIQARVRSDVADNTTILNSPAINFTDLDGTVIGNYSAAAVTARVVRPNMTIGLTGPSQCGPGDSMNYTVYLNNTGNSSTGEFWLNATLDPNLTITGSSDEAARQGTSWHAAGLVGRNVLNITARVNLSAQDRTGLSSTVSLNYTLPNGYQPAGASAPPVRTLIAAPVIEVSKAVDAESALPGDILNYTVWFNNTGSAPAASLVIHDILAPELEFVDSSAPRDATDVGWHFSNVMNDTRNRLNIMARVRNETASGAVVRNKATVNYSTATGVELSGKFTGEVLTAVGKPSVPNITLAVEADKTVAAWNETVNFTIGYNNTGDGIALRVAISDALPVGLTFVTSSAESNRAGTVWNFSSVPIGAHTLTVTAKVDSGIANNTVLTNMAILNYADSRGRLQPASYASASVTVILPPTITDRSPRPNELNVPVDAKLRITFSRPMSRNETAAAFSVSPAIQGSVSWSGNVMIFTPSAKLGQGTRYTITVAGAARDDSGNSLDHDYTWSFTTKPAGGSAGVAAWVPVAVLAAVIIGILCAAVVLATRKRDKGPPAEGETESGTPPPEEPTVKQKPGEPSGEEGTEAAEVGRKGKEQAPTRTGAKEEPLALDDVFLIYEDGRLISHHTRKLRPDRDDQILTSMFTAVQQFIDHSFGDEEESKINEISYGQSKILIEHGKHIAIAAVVAGEGTRQMHGEMQAAVHSIELECGPALENWSGNTKDLKGSRKWVQKLVAGEHIEDMNTTEAVAPGTPLPKD